MKKKDKTDRDIIDNEELIELEYELLESSEKRRPKRLRVKESKTKKASSELVSGIVIECFTNNYYRVKVGKEEYKCPLSGRFKNIDFANSRSIVVVGDHVKVDVSSNPRIEEIDERKNVLKRYIPKSNPSNKDPDLNPSTSYNEGSEDIEVVIAANIDLVIITTSVKQPELNFNLVDRYLCSAELTGVSPVICITKIDLADKMPDKKETAYYTNNGIPVILTSIITGKGINKLKQLLKGKVTVFSGPSGVGKSSLINKLEPTTDLKTGRVSSFTNKGKHITSNSIMVKWSFGGHLIDTPGIKTFGLPKKAKDKIPKIYPGFINLSKECKFSSCTHIREEGCKVLEQLEKGTVPLSRYRSYLSIYTDV